MWKYLSNMFDVATRDSFRKMLTVIADHTSRLWGMTTVDPFVQGIYNRTLPVKNDFGTAYVNWMSVKGFYEGLTFQLQNKLTELSSTKTTRWSSLIIGKFGKKSLEYKSLLPDGLEPFHNGTYEERIEAVNVLANKLANYSQLNSLKNEVQDFYDEILDFRHNQQAKESQTKNASLALQEQRMLAAKIMYANLGLFMDHHVDNPELIEQYYELKLIQSKDITDDDDSTEKKMIFVSRQVPLHEINIGIGGELGSSVLLFYDDGTNQPITFENPSPYFYNHTYTVEDDYSLKVVGNIESVNAFHCNSSQLTSVNLEDAVNLAEVVVQDNNIDQQSMNKLVILLAANGKLNGTFNAIAGTNAAPDLSIPEVAEAMSLLQARGWMILTN